MTALCPKCQQPLDLKRPKLKLCASCGAKLPINVFLQQLGPVSLLREEADSERRRKEGKPLTRQHQVIAKLRTLHPHETEFYVVAAKYLRQKFRPNRTYAFFFLVFGIVPFLFLPVLPRQPLLEIVSLIVGYLLFGALGFQLYYHSLATLRNLSKPQEGEDIDGRLQRLRKVALNNQTDPVATLVLQLTSQLPGTKRAKFQRQQSATG